MKSELVEKIKSRGKAGLTVTCIKCSQRALAIYDPDKDALIAESAPDDNSVAQPSAPAVAEPRTRPAATDSHLPWQRNGPMQATPPAPSAAMPPPRTRESGHHVQPADAPAGEPADAEAKSRPDDVEKLRHEVTVAAQGAVSKVLGEIDGLKQGIAETQTRMKSDALQLYNLLVGQTKTLRDEMVRINEQIGGLYNELIAISKPPDLDPASLAMRETESQKNSQEVLAAVGQVQTTFNQFQSTFNQIRAAVGQIHAAVKQLPAKVQELQQRQQTAADQVILKLDEVKRAAAERPQPPTAPTQAPAASPFSREEIAKIFEEILGKLLSPEHARDALEQYYSWELRHWNSSRREKIVAGLPLLFDMLDQELASWQSMTDEDAPEAERRRVVEVLQGLLRSVNAWQVQNRIHRVPTPGSHDKLDSSKHFVVRTEPPDEPGDYHHRIKEVVKSGYCVEGEEACLLREAHVVVWALPDKASAAGGDKKRE